MALMTVKRLAADIMKVGISKVRINPGDMGKADEALTRNDVRGLIKDGIVYKAPICGRRANEKHTGKGHGSRKGSSNSRNPGKKAWMKHVRSQRSDLKQLVSDGSVNKEHKRMIYMKIKSGIFKSKKAMHAYLKESNLLRDKK